MRWSTSPAGLVWESGACAGVSVFFMYRVIFCGGTTRFLTRNSLSLPSTSLRFLFIRTIALISLPLTFFSKRQSWMCVLYCFSLDRVSVISLLHRQPCYEELAMEVIYTLHKNHVHFR